MLIRNGINNNIFLLPMNRLHVIISIFFSASLLCLPAKAQEDDGLDNLLKGEVENINPVYKPVIGFGAGVLNYFGEVKNNFYTPTMGTLGYQVNMATYVDNGHFFRANFYFIGGKLTGNERSITNLSHNFNFQTDIYSFGINLNYDFDHLYKKRYGLVQPFVAVGIETVLFNSKTDSLGSYNDPETGARYNNVPYYYWSDGTIRNLPEQPANLYHSVIMQRDYTYETPIKEKEWGLGNYPEYAFSIPLEFGLDMHISNRLTLRVANSFHFTFTDNIDHVSSKNTSGIIGDKKIDWFNFTYVSLHLDLFSSKKTLKYELFFRDVDYDYSVFYGDEDNDGIFDGWDNCPGTPAIAEVDSLGCPIDSDDDGIPDYRDNQKFSSPGAYVDDNGVEITEDDLIAQLDKSMAVGHNEIDKYIRTPESYKGRTKGKKVPIPPKFKSVDTDKDGYVSFDEMLRAIDKYFDFESDLSASDIYELNSFFFSQ